MKEDRLLKWYALLLYGLVLLGVGAAAGLHYETDPDGTEDLAFDKMPAIEAMLTTALILATFISVRIALTMAREAKEQRELLQVAQYDAAAPVIVFDEYKVEYNDTTKIIMYCRNVGNEPVLDLICWVSQKDGTLPGPSRYWGTFYGYLEGSMTFFADPGTPDQKPFILMTSGWNANDDFLLSAYYTSRLHKTYLTTAICSGGVATATQWRPLANQDEVQNYRSMLDDIRKTAK